MPWGNCWSFDINSTQSQIEDEDFTDSYALVVLVAWCHLLYTILCPGCDCCHTIPAAAARARTWKKPTQEVYDRYFGLRGRHYTWKVASLAVFHSAAYRRWESCLVLEFQASATAMQWHVTLFFSPKTFENPKFHNFS